MMRTATLLIIIAAAVILWSLYDPKAEPPICNAGSAPTLFTNCKVSP